MSALCDFKLRILLAAAGALALAACSSISIFYSFADDAIEREVSFFLDLSESEQRTVEEKIDAMMAWHRSEMLPRYAAFLRSQADIVEIGEITLMTVSASYDQTRGLMFDTLRGAFQPAASVLVDHTGPVKFSFLRARMTERLEDREERAERPREDRISRRARRYVENIERFTGPLNDTQIALIERHAADTDEDAATWLTYRKRREAAFLEFLASRPDKTEIETYLEKVLLDPSKILGPEYRAYRESGSAKFKKLMYEIVTASTAEQRQSAARTFREYAAEFDRISKRLL